MFEIVLAIMSMLISIIGWYLRKQENRISELESSLTEHRLEDVSKYLTRAEMLDFADRIKADMKDVISPVSVKLQSIEEYLREGKR